MDDADAIAKRFFSVVESAALQAESDRTTAFFRIWTRKEAVLKAIGCGLNRDTRSFSVGAGASQTPDAMHSVAGLAETDDDDRAWVLVDLDVGDGFAGAVAVQSGGACPAVSVHPMTAEG